MTEDRPKADGPRSQGKATPPPKPGRVEEDACRCKATSIMSPRQLLGLMWSDLAFWKKPKK